MEIPPFFQGPQSFATGAPDGFAIVPIHLFLMMAAQLPLAPAAMSFEAITRPAGADGIYERAMSCSSN
jgi:hypothetical protein